MTEKQRQQRVLVLIPAYNEEGAIRQVVKHVSREIHHADVLVVDDGSNDNTAEEATMAGAQVIRHPINLGIGGAVQTGLKFAKQEDYDLVIRLDGDGQHNPVDIPSLYWALQTNQADVVIGSRFLCQSQSNKLPISFSRRLGICTYALLVSILTRQRATDTTSGFLGMNRAGLETLLPYLPQDYPEVESRIILHKSGLKTIEIPVQMRARQSGVSSINQWCSIYYALKVSIAVLIAALKEFPALTKEIRHAHPAGTTYHGRRLQPRLVAVDGSTDPKA